MLVESLLLIKAVRVVCRSASFPFPLHTQPILMFCLSHSLLSVQPIPMFYLSAKPIPTYSPRLAKN
jgi:hypothetical protein